MNNDSHNYEILLIGLVRSWFIGKSGLDKLIHYYYYNYSIAFFVVIIASYNSAIP